MKNIFKGRANRKIYILGLLFTIAIYFVAAMLIGGIYAAVKSSLVLGLLFLALIVFIFIALFSLHVRRLHDLGYSGFWSLVILAAPIGWLLGIYLLFAKGNDGGNNYGAPLTADVKFFRTFFNLDFKPTVPTNDVTTKYKPDLPWKIAGILLCIVGILNLTNVFNISFLMIFSKTSIPVSALSIASLAGLGILLLVLGWLVLKKHNLYALYIAIAFYAGDSIWLIYKLITNFSLFLLLPLVLRPAILIALLRPTPFGNKNRFIRKYIFKDWNLEHTREKAIPHTPDSTPDER